MFWVHFYPKQEHFSVSTQCGADVWHLADEHHLVETLTFVGEVRGLFGKDLPCSHLGECGQVEPVMGRSVRQAEGELCHIRKECLQLEATHLGAIDYTQTHTHTHD